MENTSQIHIMKPGAPSLSRRRFIIGLAAGSALLGLFLQENL